MQNKFSCIIYKWIKSITDKELEDDQFGFGKSRVTREEILALRLITEGSLRNGRFRFTVDVDLKYEVKGI